MFIDDVKPWFETGDYPTQAQFYSFFSKLRWKDEPLAIGDISGLTQILNELSQPIETFTTSAAVDFEYSLPVNFLLSDIIIKAPTTCVVAVTASTIAGEEFSIADLDVDADKGALVEVGILSYVAHQIKITGLPAGTSIKIIKKRIA
ncbi:MAG: hypothetical protein ABS68_00320 [Niastella sp. SCN 39-18]|nr:hypothetical protein [Sphingobacteriales bacterium]ODT55196.1 MAG: hypothetical protein ABS68_00320 [Niastella sp. SCN 39-18]OJW09092.1 MAG: hypothetical protein BGO53_00085 [Sphingobacteriales bacterium 39-19]